MLEDQQPPLGLRLLIDAPSRLERDERLQVIAHDPRQRQMRNGGHQVGDETGLLARALEQDRLVIGHMTGCRDPADAGQDFGVAVDQLERHAREVVWQVTARGALIGVRGKVQLAALHDVACVRKCESLARQVAAGVIEMQVRVDDPADVVGTVSQFGQRVFELRPAVRAGSRGVTKSPPPSTPTSARTTCARPRGARIRPGCRHTACTS